MKSKIASAVVIGLLFGSYIHHDDVYWHQRGRDAFVACQISRFDKPQAIQHPFSSIVSAVILTMLVFGFYELMVFLFSKMLAPKRPGNVPNSLGS